MNVTLSPCKVKDYTSCNSIVPFFKMYNYINDLHRVSCKSRNTHHALIIGFCDDNRKKFYKIFGKPHFYFRGGHYFHCWRFLATLDTFSEYVFIMTAKDKGTTIERTGDIDFNADICLFDKQFALWYEQVLINEVMV